jgi:molybdopterin molybdotransferase
VTDLVTIDEALQSILARSQPLASESVALHDAHGRVLAESARAAIDLPPFPSSAMDGYAIRAADAPGTLRIAGHAAAGRPVTAPLASGEAVGIATGGVVPDLADAVVPIEHVVASDDSVDIRADVPVGANVRPRGGDVQAGAELVPAGTRLTAAHLGALAAAGVAEVVCGRRPLVRVLTTGSELRSAGEPLAAGEIYESNGVMLQVALAATGAVVERLPAVPDDDAAHRAAIAEGLEADVLVTSGGVSVGPHDLVRRIERELGVEEVFWGVAMRPGKPLSFGVRGTTLVFGLPGNPVSSLVGSLLFVRPALLALQGSAEPRPAWAAGVLASAVRRVPARDDLLRARSALTEDGMTLTPVSGQESHMIARTATADSLVHVPRGNGELAAGTSVRYLRLD